MRRFSSCLFALSFGLSLGAQNVGIGTVSPSQRLQVVGSARLDGFLQLNPQFSATAANTVAINVATGSAVLLPLAGVQANAISWAAGVPVEGQLLYLYNGDDNDATFEGLDVPSLSASSFLFINGAWQPLGGASQDAWLLEGNAGTTPASNFVGTTDAQDLAFRTDNTEHVRITTAGNVGIGTPTPISALHVPTRVPVTRIGFFNFPDRGIRAIDVQDRYAYTGGFWAGNAYFRIYDVSDPATPAQVGALDFTPSESLYDLQVRGRYAYLSMRNIFRVIDISDPNNPTTVGSVATGQGGNHIRIQGRYAMLVQNNNPDYWNTVDISDPTNPVVVDAFNPGTNLSGLALQGRYAYTSSSTELRIFDIQNPAAPVAVSGTAFGGSASSFNDVDVQGRYAYLANGNNDLLQIFDVLNPSSPTIVGSVTLFDNPGTVRVQGRYAYVATKGFSNRTLYIVDVADPTAPTVVGSFSSDGIGDDFTIQGRYGYFTASSGASGNDLFTVLEFGGSVLQNVEAGAVEAFDLVARNALYVHGSAEISDGLNVGRSLQVTGNASINGNLCYTGSIGTCSDARFKQDIQPIGEALPRLLQLQGKRYTWRQGEFPDRAFAQGEQLGFIAQELEQWFPELVHTDAEGYKYVNYAQLTPVLVEALRELNAKVEAQQAQLDALPTPTEWQAVKAQVAALAAEAAGRAAK